VLVRAGDESMSPEISLNDLCVIDPSLDPVHGSIVCTQITAPGRETFCNLRWYLDTQDAVVLQTCRQDDPDHPPIVLVRQRGGGMRYMGTEISVKFRGVMAGLIRSYPLPG
jgi:hypothetical protein